MLEQMQTAAEELLNEITKKLYFEVLRELGKKRCAGYNFKGN